MQISIENGKYTFVFGDAVRSSHVLRYGEPWLINLLGVRGSKCWIAMAYEISIRRERATKEEASARYDNWVYQHEQPGQPPIKLPVMTKLLHTYCNNDPKLFEELTEIIREAFIGGAESTGKDPATGEVLG
jgi:hypothetical protein